MSCIHQNPGGARAAGCKSLAKYLSPCFSASTSWRGLKGGDLCSAAVDELVGIVAEVHRLELDACAFECCSLERINLVLTNPRRNGHDLEILTIRS